MSLFNRNLKMLIAFAYIFLFLGLGELIVYFIDISVPGNILGMILIFVALKLKIVKLETVLPHPNMDQIAGIPFVNHM